MASQIEDWIVDQIKAIQFESADALDPEDVKPWEGTSAGTIEKIADQLFSGKRNTAARVLFVSDSAEDLADAQIEIRGRYLILIGIRNFRPGAARRGDGSETPTRWGTNAMRDLLKAAFNQKTPDLTDGTTYTDVTRYMGATIEFNSETSCVLKVMVEVTEVPSAAA